MNYIVDKSLIGDGILQYTTESGCRYLAKIFQTSPGSDLWSIDFAKISGEPSSSEIFKIMKTLTDASMEYAFEKNINNVIIFIAGETQELIEQKTIVFQRWLNQDWDLKIIPNMDLKISGMRNSIITVPTNTIMMSRKKTTIQKQVVINGNANIKFCFNCGTENKDFQFCPNCGTNLKQT